MKDFLGNHPMEHRFPFRYLLTKKDFHSPFQMKLIAKRIKVSNPLSAKVFPPPQLPKVLSKDMFDFRRRRRRTDVTDDLE